MIHPLYCLCWIFSQLCLFSSILRCFKLDVYFLFLKWFAFIFCFMVQRVWLLQLLVIWYILDMDLRVYVFLVPVAVIECYSSFCCVINFICHSCVALWRGEKSACKSHTGEQLNRSVDLWLFWLFLCMYFPFCFSSVPEFLTWEFQIGVSNGLVFCGLQLGRDCRNIK